MCAKSSTLKAVYCAKCRSRGGKPGRGPRHNAVFQHWVLFVFLFFLTALKTFKVKTGQNKIWAPNPDLLKHVKFWLCMQLALAQPLTDVSFQP